MPSSATSWPKATVMSIKARALPHDADPGGLAEVLRLVRERRASAQVFALRDGKVILDESVGCRPDDLFLIFSAGKAIIAVLVHMLAERQLLDLGKPVACYWPQFGQHGKQAITLRQVLQHRAGVPVARSIVRDALAATSWDRSVRALET